MLEALRPLRARAIAGGVGLAALAGAAAIAPPATAPAAKATPKFEFRVYLTKVGETTWRGTATEKRGLGRGTMTLTGLVVGADAISHSTFKIRFARGEVRGCTVTDFGVRPRDRLSVAGEGRITSASRPYRNYKGVKLGLDGRVRLANTNRVLYWLGNTHPGQPAGRC
jgi:hypothetical protein